MLTSPITELEIKEFISQCNSFKSLDLMDLTFILSSVIEKLSKKT